MGCDGRVSAYWCAIGTTGTLTPTIRPISWANMPPAFTTTSQAMRPRSVSTWVTRRRPWRSSTPMPVTRVMVAISAPRLRAPAASAIVRSVGLSQPSVGSHTAPRTSGGVEQAVEALERVLGRDELEGQAERLGPAGLAGQLLHPLDGRGQAQRAHLVPSGVVPGLGGQPAVEVGAVHHHPGQRDAAAELADQPGRVERRARGQLVPLHQHDVVPAQQRQVVGDAGPAHAATDDHRTGLVTHGPERSDSRHAPRRSGPPRSPPRCSGQRMAHRRCKRLTGTGWRRRRREPGPHLNRVCEAIPGP